MLVDLETGEQFRGIYEPEHTEDMWAKTKASDPKVIPVAGETPDDAPPIELPDLNTSVPAEPLQ